MSSKNVTVYNANSKATIRTRIDRNGSTRTETRGRDSGIDVALITNNKGTTELFIDGVGRDFAFDGSTDQTMRLNGHEARTLYRALGRHFEATGKSQYAF